VIDKLVTLASRTLLATDKNSIFEVFQSNSSFFSRFFKVCFHSRFFQVFKEFKVAMDAQRSAGLSDEEEHKFYSKLAPKSALFCLQRCTVKPKDLFVQPHQWQALAETF